MIGPESRQRACGGRRHVVSRTRLGSRRRPIALPERRRTVLRQSRGAAAELIARLTVLAALVAIVVLVILAQDLVALVALALATLLGVGLVLIATADPPGA
jgi:hypothetical protein